MPPTIILERAEQWSGALRRRLLAHPDWRVRLPGDAAAAITRKTVQDWHAEQFHCTGPVTDEKVLKQGLRLWRDRVFFSLMLRDIAGQATLHEVMAAMSHMADLAIAQAYAHAMQTLQARHGQAVDPATGRPLDMLILGMGKLGGKELNVSSDIDLVVLYGTDGQTQGQHSISHHEFFSRLCRQMCAILSDVNADGFVFRTDLRLRPDGANSPLAWSLPALENYLLRQGREWERYAWLKARIIPCALYDQDDFQHWSQQLEQLRIPFVYRKYFDFDALGALRNLRERIRSDWQRRARARKGIDAQHNIKLGEGGIREIEFVIQLNQLIRAGRRPSLQQRSLLAALHKQRRAGILDEQVANGLEAAYVFLRRLENHLQYREDEQTHLLPADENIRAALAKTMGFASLDDFHLHLAEHRGLVAQCFRDAFRMAGLENHTTAPGNKAQKQPDNAPDRLPAIGLATGSANRGNADSHIGAPHTGHKPAGAPEASAPAHKAASRHSRVAKADTSRAFPASRSDRPRQPDKTGSNLPATASRNTKHETGLDFTIADLKSLAGDIPQELASQLLTQLDRLRDSRKIRGLPSSSQQRLRNILPRAVQSALVSNKPGITLQRLLDLLENIAQRRSYLALLDEYPQTLERLARIVAASPWASQYLSRYPLLLDSLIEWNSLMQPPDFAQLAEQLRSDLDACLLPDGTPDMEQQMNLMRETQHQVSFRLLAQDLANVISVEVLADHLSALADMLLDETIHRVWPQVLPATQDDCPPEPHFAIIAYGKLGGKEIGYASDLDLVFLYDDPDQRASELYVRLGRRVASWLSTLTSSGRLYDIDLRLRPDGEAGLLAVPINAFERYQLEQAWPWEHQALTRARFVAGDKDIGARFEKIRERILLLPRDTQQLRQQVIDMREKILQGHPNSSADFDLKHDRGGMVDVEFITQYLVLSHARKHPELLGNLGNIALLGLAAQAKLIPALLAAEVADAYRQFRQRQHALRLQGAERARIPQEEFTSERAAVLNLWQAVLLA